MLKEYKSNEELIAVMKSRNIKFSNINSENVIKDLLDKYTYNMIVNPNKILYCTGIDKNLNHIYQNEVDSSYLVNTFEKEKEFNIKLFEKFSLFESNFSSILTDIYLRKSSEINMQIREEIIFSYLKLVTEFDEFNELFIKDKDKEFLKNAKQIVI